MHFFSHDLEGRFLQRPNRFSVEAETDQGIIRAHCPNPGRLTELLLPGRRLIFEKSSNPNRKTQWTLAAVEYHGKIIPLISVRANRAAAELVLPRLFPDALEIRPEYQIGHSRFDFHVQLPEDRRVLVEVKSCTLAAEGRAMFPDAPTERGRRHIEHMAQIVQADRAAGLRTEGLILFMLHHPDVECFSPNIHSDPEFGIALEKAASTLSIRAASLLCNEAGSCRLADPEVQVDLSPAVHARHERGAYLMVLELKKAQRIKVGALGPIDFAAGTYVYAGSAKQHLSSRVARHLRKKSKKFHWHIDYLRAQADSAQALPVYTAEDIECRLASALADLGGEPVPDFGASDCTCNSHLYRFESSPLQQEAFHDMLLRFRHAHI